MTFTFARRMAATPRSFIMELISICQDPEIISLASGLPDISMLPQESIAMAAERMLSEEEGRTSLQYSVTEGYLPLREFIAERYKRRLHLDVDPENMIMVNGSQQCFDLMGKVLLDPGSPVMIEAPGYLGAIQGFSLYEPEFLPITLSVDGPDLDSVGKAVKRSPRLFYAVPNAQNPMGATYSKDSRESISSLIADKGIVVLEDDAYGELNFDNRPLPPLARFMPGNTVITGSFSKILAPGMRCGWMVGPKEIMDQVNLVKGAADLHSNLFSQRIIYQWLRDNDLDAHISRINRHYKGKRDLMLSMLDDLMPEEISYTRPSGGLFVWMTLSRGDSMDLFNRALRHKVAIMPGSPFYTDGGGERGIRLNFATSSSQQIEEGVHRFARAVREYLGSL